MLFSVMWPVLSGLLQWLVNSGLLGEWLSRNRCRKFLSFMHLDNCAITNIDFGEDESKLEAVDSDYFIEPFDFDDKCLVCEDVSSSLKTEVAASPCRLGATGRSWLKNDLSSQRKEDVSSGRFDSTKIHPEIVEVRHE